MRLGVLFVCAWTALLAVSPAQARVLGTPLSRTLAPSIAADGRIFAATYGGVLYAFTP
jgi:hypothetical protein